jgi:hypothetical protein
MSNPIKDILNNIKNNKVLLYTTLLYIAILFFLCVALYYIYSQQTKVTGLGRVTPPIGSEGVDHPRDA